MARNRLNQAEKAPVAQWIEQRFPKPRALVRFRPGATLAHKPKALHSGAFVRLEALTVPPLKGG
jgi:hypothetical protein